MFHIKSLYFKPIMKLHDTIINRLRSSSKFTKILFGVNVKERSHNRLLYWDYTTLILKKALLELTYPGQKLLEIGVGDSAILSILTAKRFSVSVTGVDIVPQVVANAKKSLFNNDDVSVDIRESDIFSNVQGKFDIIFWNFPYMSKDAQLYRFSSDTEQFKLYDNIQVDGGADGTDLIRRFLNEAPHFIEQNGKLLLGLNTFYVKSKTIITLINQTSFHLEKVISCFPNPSKVFVCISDNK